ncbi:MAG: exodeoxyribonuclease VII large subunit [Xanthomonadales bacterium]|nr:exodeoxyribonuclease VII large subunit [Xanthomonadales bacterium]
MQKNIFTPSQLNRLVKNELEMSFPSIWIEGEISNLSQPGSGHLYFSLKDNKAQINCALFKGNRTGLAVKPENGLLVRVRGKISLYEPRGNYQLIANRMEPAGAGELQQRFEELKKQLAHEGLFATESKQALADNNHNIAVISSASGAAIRDIITILGRRWPLANVRLYPVPVQGNEAAPAIVSALQAANQHSWADVIILGRGGGSLEDLWAFNEESVARAVFASNIPVVSAVGHEIDTVISDFVADLRAATPSAAAELVVPDQRLYQTRLREHLRNLSNILESSLRTRSQQLDHLEQRLFSRHPEKQLSQQQQQLSSLQKRIVKAITRCRRDAQIQLKQWQQRLAQLDPAEKISDKLSILKIHQQRLQRSMQLQLDTQQNLLNASARTLHALSPLTTLDRGYSITRESHTGKVIVRAEQLAQGDSVTSTFANGEVKSTVTEVNAHKAVS